MTISCNRVQIDLAALTYNLNQVKALIGPDTRIMGVVKSDAYGHGIVRVSRLLQDNGIHCLGVAHVHEALLLRQNRISLPLIILCSIRDRKEAQEAVRKCKGVELDGRKLIVREARPKKRK